MLIALTVQAIVPLIAARAQNIEPANPKATQYARNILSYLYNLPKQTENRIISGHLAGGSVGPSAPRTQDGGYKFKMDEIEYLH